MHFNHPIISMFLARPMRSLFLGFTLFILSIPVHAQDANNFPTELFQAIERDVGIPRNEVKERLEKELESARQVKNLQSALGKRYGGAWFDPVRNQLTVGVTNREDQKLVEVTGARFVLVDHSLKALESEKKRLDEASRIYSVPPAIWSWYVDPQSNQVIVLISHDSETAIQSGADFIALSQANEDVIAFKVNPEKPRLLNDIIGGEGYINTSQNSICSIGFSVEGGYATAGHCGDVGEQVSSLGGSSQGGFAGSIFPTNDMAWVDTNGQWTQQPYVGTSLEIVNGSTEALIGQTVCRYGTTTGGPHCGLIMAKNQTVLVNGGYTLQGLTHTDACAEPGDSGGPYIHVDQAQGVLSAGSGSCASGGETWFQPINPLLDTYNLTLVTGGSNIPGRPVNLNGSLLCFGNWVLAWGAPTSGGPVDEYQLFSSSQSSFDPQTLEWTGSTTSTAVSLGTSGASLKWYRVRACNSSGCGNYSNSVRLQGFSGCP